MLWALKQKLNLRVLALTVDYWFLTEETKRNVDLTVKNLGIDHVYVQTDWQLCKQIFSSAVKYFGEICLGCEGLLTINAFYSALCYDIPCIAWGMRSGQFRTEPNPVIPNDKANWEKIKSRRLDPLLNNYAGFMTGIDVSSLKAIYPVHTGCVHFPFVLFLLII